MVGRARVPFHWSWWVCEWPEVSEKYNFKPEVLTGTKIWFSRISEYSTTHTSDAVYIIGGKYTMEIVAEFKDNIWRQLPELFEEPGIHERQIKMD